MKAYEWPVFWVLVFEWPNFSDTHVYAHIFARILVKPLFSHLHKAVFRMTRVICKLIYKSQRIWNCILNQRTVYEYRSTFCVIEYMNRLFFFLFFLKGPVYDWGWFPNTDSHIRTNNIPDLPAPPPSPETTLPPVFVPRLFEEKRRDIVFGIPSFRPSVRPSVLPSP